MSEFSHLNQRGEAHMVDVSEKKETTRVAVAESLVRMSQQVLTKITSEQNPKGDIIATARVAGIQAAKKCSDLIPLCHPLPLEKVSVDLEITDIGIRIFATCKTSGKTGVEMEALCAASVTALTIYDMCKAIDKGIVIEKTRLIEKTGGKSGSWSHTNQVDQA